MTDSARLADRQRAIAAAVKDLRRDVVSSLRELVNVPSQTGSEGAAQAVMTRLMREQGLEVDVWEPDVAQLEPYRESLTLGDDFAGRPNLVGAWRGRGGRSLILNGHIDTVEVGNPASWRVDPLGGEVRGGRLYGRGACDMKAGLVANVFALRALRRAGLAPQGDVFVQSTISEEDGGAGALAAVLRGYTADAVLISEPTALEIVAAQGGSLMFRLHVSGLSAHACVRDEGVSAIENFAYLHQGLLAFERRHNQEIGHPLYAAMGNKAPINIGTVRGGTWASSVPEAVVAEGRAGLVPGESLEEFKVRLARDLAEVAARHPWLRQHPPSMEWLEGQFAPAGVSEESPLVGVLAGAVQRVTGSPPRVGAVTYGADMRHFVNSGGMPCLMFGAGDVRLAHAPDESIAIDDLLVAIAVTAEFVADWCGVTPA